MERDPDESLTPLARTSSSALGIGLVVLTTLVVLKLTAPDDFDAHDQAKQGLYVVDAWTHGRWLVPLELGTEFPTKPPLMTWLSLGVAFVQGRLDRFQFLRANDGHDHFHLLSPRSVVRSP